ncbi:DNA phosphorothioation system restriction enzyme [Baaleninema sp.]|uniref:DNA phosphorothioation system restriction enzyme n=1 Tax=Baaleninema sp. TaxID=3101197 RepID=UPI003D00BCEA
MGTPWGCPQFPDDVQLRPYQERAVRSWFASNGRGTLKMATGSGKTITALAVATRLYETLELQVLVVVCPYRHLVTQWARECQRFHLTPILAFESVHQWQGELTRQLYRVRSNSQRFLTLITTNATLISESFQSQLRYLPAKTLIVGDEAHNLGAPRLEASLPRHVKLRLGLSATPERYFDEGGTDALLDYFGSVLKPELTLGDAIRAGALVRYTYFPVFVNLTETESRLYALLTHRIGWALQSIDREPEDLTALLVRRARLVGTASNKIAALRSVMRTRLNTSHTLFYCSDGTNADTDESQLEAVVRLLGSELGYRVNTYIAETSISQRERLRRQFESGVLQGLVAIRCLDEGVDVPAIRTAIILASSRNPRQFVQRRGRILRPHPGKERATLFDTIVLPPQLDRQTWEVERNLLKKELQRFVEFADLAENAADARLKLLKLQQRYGLLDV